MIKFPGLSTMIISTTGGDIVWVANDLIIDTQANMGSASPLVARFLSGEFEKHIALTSVDSSAPGYWPAVSWPNERPVVIRSTVETDSVAAVHIGVDIPLPLSVMSYLVRVPTPVKLFALTDDDGFVVTMMLDSQAGLYLRFSGMWFDMVEEVVDGLGLTEVETGALDMFDQYDRSGQLVSVSAMPKSATAEITSSVVAVTPALAGSLAGEAVLDVPRLDSAEDLAAAITFAEEAPEFRWWVERRAKAMGLAAEFPWDGS